MELATVGDRVVVESEHVGERARKGEVLEVLGPNDAVHYQVRWEDGRKSFLYPAAGSTVIVHKKAAKA